VSPNLEKRSSLQGTLHRNFGPRATPMQRLLSIAGYLTGQRPPLDPRLDDQYTSSRWLGGTLWETTGVVESTLVNHRTLREPWRVLFDLSGIPNRPVHPVFVKVGEKVQGNEAEALRLANSQ
jgi:hypothetical protein